MPRKRICKQCLKNYRRSKEGRRARKQRWYDKASPWGKGKWPAWVYQDTGKRLCLKHAAQRRAHTMARHAAKLAATPAWVDWKAVLVVYEKAQRIQHTTGEKMHVDHIIPLKGKNVCGLHTHENLQVLPALENIKKGNRHKP